MYDGREGCRVFGEFPNLCRDREEEGGPKGVDKCANGCFDSYFISIGKSSHDDVGGLYIEGVVFRVCVSLDSDEFIPDEYA